MDTKENRKKQFKRGLSDAKTPGTVYGQSNELGTLSEALNLAYERGWRKGRREPVPGPTFITSNRYFELLYYSQLTAKEQKELDYVTEDTNSFFRYRDYIYDLSEFARIIPPEDLSGPSQHPMCLRDYKGEFDDWDGYQSDSHSGGLVVRYRREENGDFDPERIVIGTYYYKG